MLTTLRQFTSNREDLRAIYISFIRPTLEYCSQLWHPGLTKQLAKNIERVQKRACRIIIGYENYIDYTSACRDLNLDTLYKRRQAAFSKLATDILKDANHPLYPSAQLYDSDRSMRRPRRFAVPRARSERYRKSVVPALIRAMNAMKCS